MEYLGRQIIEAGDWTVTLEGFGTVTVPEPHRISAALTTVTAHTMLTITTARGYDAATDYDVVSINEQTR